MQTVREDIQANNLNRLRQIVQHVDYSVDQLSALTFSLQVNPEIKMLSSIDMLDSYEQIRLRKSLSDMLRYQALSQGWNNEIALYSHSVKEWIGTADIIPSPVDNSDIHHWQYNPESGRFIRYLVDQDFTIRVMFPKSNLQEIVDNAKIEHNNPFFVNDEGIVVMNNHIEKETLTKMLEALSSLDSNSNHNEGTIVISIGGIEYMVNFLRSSSLGWYLIDFLPLDEALQPIYKTKRVFYITCSLLLISSIIILVYLYRKIQIPIITMLKGVRLIKEGDYSYRIKRISNNEFDILFKNFNDMTEEIEDLVERVYKEKVISREASIKQLQAQINPHFLYNCLFFINNMNRLGNYDAVEAMTENLAAYFRYTTRLEQPTTTFDKELDVVMNYLTIQKLRMERLNFYINFPDEMKSLVVPKLLIQPLVENSVVHGIERKNSKGVIRVIGKMDPGQISIVVEDNGVGMTENEMHELRLKMNQPLDDKIGCALWNIQQRLVIHYGNSSGIRFTKSDLGGLRVTLYWPNHNIGGELPYV